MYESFYSLKEKPFDLHPDPDYLFMSHGQGHGHLPLRNNIFTPCPRCGSYCDLSGEEECFDKTLFTRQAA